MFLLLEDLGENWFPCLPQLLEAIHFPFFVAPYSVFKASNSGWSPSVLHLSVVCCLPLSPLKTLVTTLVPPGYTRLISYLKFSNLNFICNPNSSLPCNVTYLQSLVIKTLNYNSLRIYLIFTLGHFVVMVCYLQYWLYNNLSSMNIKNFLRSCLTHSKLSKLLASIKIVISWYYLNFLTKQLNKSSFLY